MDKLNKHIIVFSHGFGVRKDDRGLFTDIIGALRNIEPVMFDYNDVDEAKNLLTVKPLTRQAMILEKVLQEVMQSNPESAVDLICHSQGSVVAALVKPQGIRKIIFLAPPCDIGAENMAETFKDRPGSEIDFEGISKLGRLDGSITIVPAEFWKELSEINPLELYNKLADQTELTIISASRDEILGKADFQKLSPKAKLICIDGDHNFTGKDRERLLEIVKEIVI